MCILHGYALEYEPADGTFLKTLCGDLMSVAVSLTFLSRTLADGVATSLSGCPQERTALCLFVQLARILSMDIEFIVGNASTSSGARIR